MAKTIEDVEQQFAERGYGAAVAGHRRLIIRLSGTQKTT